MEKQIYFIYNPTAGKGSIKKNLSNIVSLLNKYDYEVIVYATAKKGDAYNKMVEIGNHFPFVLCAGGDGTLNEIVSAYQHLTKKPHVSYLPTGTTNDFANSMKINKNIMKCLKSILENKQEITYDIGQLNEYCFNYVAAFGSISEVSYSTPQTSKNILGHTAYLAEGLKQLIKLKKYKVAIEYDDGIIEDEICLGMISNSLSIGGFKFFKEDDIKLDDGFFECIFIKNPNNPLDIHQTVHALSSKQYHNNNQIYTFKTKKLHIRFNRNVKWTIDGEFAGKLKECKIVNIHNGMTLVK